MICAAPRAISRFCSAESLLRRRLLPSIHQPEGNGSLISALGFLGFLGRRTILNVPASYVNHQLSELRGIAGQFSALFWHDARLPRTPWRSVIRAVGQRATAAR